MLRRYRSDLPHVMPVEEIELNSDLSYDEEPVEILTSDGKVLRSRTIELVKVKWRHRGMEEATWERKEDMMEGNRLGWSERRIGSSGKIASAGEARSQGGPIITFVQGGTETFREGFETFSMKVPKPCPKVSIPLMKILILPERFVLLISIFYKLVPRCGCVQLVELEVLVWAENLHASMKHD
ncbi:hypothetical protein GQ457_14G017580 [Hibiscus cannabinus]